MITDPVALAAQQNLAAVTSASGTLPTGGSTGDRIGMIVSLRVATTTTIATATSGWTKLGQGQEGTTGAVMAYFEADWGAASPAFTWGGASINGWIQPIVLRGRGSTATPVFGTGTTAAITLPSFTATTRGDWVIYAVGNYGATTYTALPDGVFAYRNAIGGGSTTATRTQCYVGKFANLSEFSTGTRSMTGVAASWVAMTLVVHPATPATFGLVRCRLFTSSSATNAPSATALGAHVTGSPTVTGVVSVQGWSAGTRHITGATRGATAMTAVTNANSPSSQAEGDIYYIDGVTASGDVAYAAALSGTADAADLFVAEYVGTASSGSLDVGGHATGTGTAVSITTTGNVGAGDRLVIAQAGNGNNGSSWAFDANFQPRVDYRLGSTNQTPIAVQGREFTAPDGATTSGAFTIGASGTWVGSIAVFKPGSSGVSGTSTATVAQQTATEAGQVAVTGAGTGSQSTGGSATGTVPIVGASTGAQVESGTGSATVSTLGQSSKAQGSSGGSATGTVINPPVTGASSGTQASVGGSGTGAVPVAGSTTTGQGAEAGLATGAVLVSGQGTGSQTTGGSGAGGVRVGGQSTGAQAGEGGAGTGKAAVSGASTGQQIGGGTGTGAVPVVGGSTGSQVTTGSGAGAIGNVPVSGASTVGQGPTTGQSTGQVPVSGQGVGAQTTTGTATGQVPATGGSTAAQGPDFKDGGTGTVPVAGKSVAAQKGGGLDRGTGGVVVGGTSTGQEAPVTGSGTGTSGALVVYDSVLEVVVLGAMTTVGLVQGPLVVIDVTQLVLTDPAPVGAPEADITVTSATLVEVGVVVGG